MSLGPIRATGKHVRDTHHAFNSMIHCPTWGRYEITMPSTPLSYLGPIRATGKHVRDTHHVFISTVLIELTAMCVLF